MSWLSDLTYNKVKGSYFNDNIEMKYGDLKLYNGDIYCNELTETDISGTTTTTGGNIYANNFYENNILISDKYSTIDNLSLKSSIVYVDDEITTLENSLYLKADKTSITNVDNTSDLNKPISTLVQTSLDLKADKTSISNIDNTSDLNKPISTLTQTSLDLKANKSLITNVDNTSDLNKPISTLTQTALDLKADKTSISNIDNTSDVDKPISTAQQYAINLKANGVNPSFLGTINCYTISSLGGYIDMPIIIKPNSIETTTITATTYNGITKSMVSGITNIDNTTDLLKPISTATQTAINLKANLASPIFSGTVSGITSSMIGLGNVSNVTSALLPISTATQTALDKKANSSNAIFTGTLTLSNIGVVSGFTKDMVGLSLVENIADANKVISTATKTYVDAQDVLLQNQINTLSSSQSNNTTSNNTWTGTNTFNGTSTFVGGVSGLSKSTVGLSLVDNTTDISKPISTLVQSALDLKADNTSISNINNTSDLSKPISTLVQSALDLKADNTSINNINNTSDLSKPISTLVQSALDLKADNTSISNINNTSDLSKPVSTATQTALNLKANLASPTFSGTVSGITSSMIGLGNVDNTTDLLKPVSTATQTALNLKAPINNPVFTGTATFGTGAVSMGNTLSVTNSSTFGNGNDLSRVRNNLNIDNCLRIGFNDVIDVLSSSSQAGLANTLGAKLDVKGNIYSSGTITGATYNGITKSMISDLTNVDNTADVDKPISTAQQYAINLKANGVNPSFLGTINCYTISSLGGYIDIPVLIKPDSIETTTITATTYNGITKSMIGLANVDNTTDLLKPISTATQTALDLKANQTSISNIDNTSDLLKPISTATQTALDLKANQTSISNINNTTDLLKPISTATQTALNLKANLASPTFSGTVSGITKSMIGLANVENTTDLLKPVSTATQTALNLKADKTAITNLNSTTGTITTLNSTTGTITTLNSTTINATNVISRKMTAGYMMDGTVTTYFSYIPIIASLRATNPNDSDDAWIIEPGYKLILYEEQVYYSVNGPWIMNNYTGTTPMYKTSIQLMGVNNSISSYKLYYLSDSNEITYPNMS